MSLICFLIGFPLVAAVLCLLLPTSLRNAWVLLSSAVVAVASVWLASAHLGGGPILFEAHSHLLDEILFVGGLVVAGFLLYCCRRIKSAEFYIPVLIVAQTVIIAWAEKGGRAPEVKYGLYIDSFSVIMVLIIGLVGTLIAVYAVSYMKQYHAHHKDVPDRCGQFFAIFFLFLSGMFAIVLSNHLGWLFFGWEITTLCSFLLIGYSKTEQATRNAFRALGLNLIGGAGFALAILMLTLDSGPGHTLSLDQLIELGPGLALLPALLISFAGLAKSAQMPFSSWLLGAMVAPTPVSALLHSSTMVKAGVFIIIKFAPVFQNTVGGYLVALVGALTFLGTSIIAVTQSDAKRVLAYSTIANLGLIVLCAGVGTPETVWAAVLLTVFHAVAKALLFLGTGSIEHQIGSRDIEAMEGLIVRRPVIAVMMLIGILGMFLAPFGMLISKYATLKALLEAEGLPAGGIFLAIVLAFGSAPTLLFWSKWMGKIVAGPRTEVRTDRGLPGLEKVSLGLLAVFTFLACVLFAPLAQLAIEPYVAGVFGSGTSIGLASAALISMIIMMGLLFLLPLLYLFVPHHAKLAPAYLAGANVEGSASYRGAMGATRAVETRNYYLTGFFDEKKLFSASFTVSLILILIMFLSQLP